MPPICIKTKITICPNKDHLVKVSAIINPVTQVALVAVKRASKGYVQQPSLDAIGKHKNNVPVNIKRIKLNAISREGLILCDNFPNIC